jgi:hypothetical protein
VIRSETQQHADDTALFFHTIAAGEGTADVLSVEQLMQCFADWTGERNDR